MISKWISSIPSLLSLRHWYSRVFSSCIRIGVRMLRWRWTLNHLKHKFFTISKLLSTFEALSTNYLFFSKQNSQNSCKWLASSYFSCFPHPTLFLATLLWRKNKKECLLIPLPHIFPQRINELSENRVNRE